MSNKQGTEALLICISPDSSLQALKLGFYKVLLDPSRLTAQSSHCKTKWCLQSLWQFNTPLAPTAQIWGTASFAGRLTFAGYITITKHSSYLRIYLPIPLGMQKGK